MKGKRQYGSDTGGDTKEERQRGNIEKRDRGEPEGDTKGKVTGKRQRG